MKRWFAGLVVFLFPLAAEAGGDYLGQKPPGNEPVLFAPGIVSTGLSERDIAITPDGNEIYFGAYAGAYRFAVIMTVRRTGGTWGTPEVAPFSGIPGVMDLEPALTHDGKRLYFLSDREKRGQDIWYVDREGSSWSAPKPLGPPVCTEADEYFPSLTRDGTLYFTLQGDPSRRDGIYRSRLKDGAYAAPERLPDHVNSGRARYNGFIAADESYLIYAIVGRADGLGGSDYYVSFRSPEDVWSEPVNLGPKINSAADEEYSASVTRDGRYLFFMSTRTAGPSAQFGDRVTAAALQRLATSPGNGNADIWWVDASFIETLRNRIHIAAEAGDVDRVRTLLAVDPSLIGARGERGRTPLYSAARAGHTPALAELLAGGADVNATEAQGATPLHAAAFFGHVEAVRFLLAAGAEVNAQDRRGNTPLASALSASRRAVVAPLLAAGADVNLKDSFGTPPLQMAIMRGFEVEAAEMLSRGADIDATGFNGSTALHLAVENRARGILAVLLERGASAGIRDGVGDTALHKAAAEGDGEVLELLLARSPDLEARSDFGRTPLHQAAAGGYAAVVRRLLECGAARDVKDVDGSMPIDLALRHQHPDVAAVLDPSASVAPAEASTKGAVMVWYLGNSGWAVRIGSHLLIFDYWNYSIAPDRPSLASGRVLPQELKGLHVYVFTTHAHPDHYDPSILGLAEESDATLIFGWNAGAGGTHPAFSGRREARRIGDLDVRQVSDGESSAFLVRVDGTAVFHGGDYLGGTERQSHYEWLAAAGPVDIAFVDFGETYRAIRAEALTALKPRIVFPMHARRMEFLYQKAAQAMAGEFPQIHFLCARDRGDRFDCSRRSR